MSDTASDLVVRLRSKIGDNPTGAGTGGDEIPDPSRYIWTDAELLMELDSARRTIFKGAMSTLDLLDEVQEEMVLLGAAASLQYMLATNAARYGKYSLRDVEVQRLAPSEFLQIAKAFDARLQLLVEESADDNAGATVQQGVFTRYDRTRDLYLPSRAQQRPKVPPFTVDVLVSTIVVTVRGAIIPTYRDHFLKKAGTGFAESIIRQWYQCIDQVFIDSDVQHGGTYTYTVCVADVNNEVATASKTVTFP